MALKSRFGILQFSLALSGSSMRNMYVLVVKDCVDVENSNKRYHLYLENVF